jgi:hypothetical protein
MSAAEFEGIEAVSVAPASTGNHLAAILENAIRCSLPKK